MLDFNYSKIQEALNNGNQKLHKKVRKVFTKILLEASFPDIKTNCLKLLDMVLEKGTDKFRKTICGGSPPKLIQALENLGKIKKKNKNQ